MPFATRFFLKTKDTKNLRNHRYFLYGFRCRQQYRSKKNTARQKCRAVSDFVLFLMQLLRAVTLLRQLHQRRRLLTHVFAHMFGSLVRLTFCFETFGAHQHFVCLRGKREAISCAVVIHSKARIFVLFVRVVYGVCTSGFYNVYVLFCRCRRTRRMYSHRLLRVSCNSLCRAL